MSTVAVSLYLWGIVAATPAKPFYGWQYMGQFNGRSACHAAAFALSVTEYRCIGANGEIK